VPAEPGLEVDVVVGGREVVVPHPAATRPKIAIARREVKRGC
jgi:hypothetical protein